MNVKLGDFGLAVELDSMEFTKSICGSNMAPEMLKKKDYSFEVDIWALGIIMYLIYNLVISFY